MKKCETDGILDDCACGERPYLDRNREENWHQASCVSCGAATDKHDNSTDVMVQWNRMQRGIKERVKKKWMNAYLRYLSRIPDPETCIKQNAPAHPRAVASRGEAGCSAIQSKGDRS